MNANYDDGTDRDWPEWIEWLLSVTLGAIFLGGLVGIVLAILRWPIIGFFLAVAFIMWMISTVIKETIF